MNKTKIIIIGAGFGGTYTARYLHKIFGKKADIKIFDKTNYFLFTPLLHEVATGGLSARNIVESMDEIFKDKVEFIKEPVISIDKNTKKIETYTNNYPYDLLVVSPGAETAYYGIEGAKENSFPLKTLEDAVKMRNAILENIERAVKENNKKYLRFSVIGGGATGVELATELIDYAKTLLHCHENSSSISEKDISVNIITNTASLIQQFPEKMRVVAQKELEDMGINVKTNATVSKIEKGIIRFQDGSTLESEMIIWVAGVSPTVKHIAGIELNEKGRIETNASLQSIQDKNIFALGDSASHYPMLAQVAVRQAKVVAKNIYRAVNNKDLSPYDKDVKGLLLSLGRFNAMGDVNGHVIHGLFMWFVWRTVYLLNFHSWKNRLKIASEWTAGLFSSRDVSCLR